MPENLTNWAGNHHYRAAGLHRPKTVEELQELVARCRKLKVVGARHSFNDIADTTGDLISLEHFDQVVALDHERRTVTVAGGIRYGELGRHLHREGYALHNLASLPHITVAGACATATHGSGDRNGNLATAVAAMELVTASGDVVTLSREGHGDQFLGAVVGLGGLGVVTKLTLDIAPTFEMRQDVYENLPMAGLEDSFDDIHTRAYSVSLFTDWRGEHINQVWFKRRVTQGARFTPEPEVFGATLATAALHPIAGMSAASVTPQLGVHGPWHERMPHFRLEHQPSNGEELQSEYMAPRRHALAALRAVAGLRERVAPLLQAGEIRTIAADNLWMSTCYQQDSVGIHFTWIQDWPAVKQLLPLLEEQLAPFQARPHWGKLFTMQPQHLQSLYPKLPDFRRLLQEYDPQGKFRNEFLDTYIFS